MFGKELAEVGVEFETAVSGHADGVGDDFERAVRLAKRVGRKSEEALQPSGCGGADGVGLDGFVEERSGTGGGFWVGQRHEIKGDIEACGDRVVQ